MRLLVVDDDPDFRSLIESSAPEWLQVVTCSSAKDALVLLDRGATAEFALVDLNMPPSLAQLPHLEGAELARRMADHHNGPPSILVSASLDTRSGRLDDGPLVVGSLRKPVDLDRLYRFLEAFRDLFARDPGRICAPASLDEI